MPTQRDRSNYISLNPFLPPPFCCCSISAHLLSQADPGEPVAADTTAVPEIPAPEGVPAAADGDGDGADPAAAEAEAEAENEPEAAPPPASPPSPASPPATGADPAVPRTRAPADGGGSAAVVHATPGTPGMRTVVLQKGGSLGIAFKSSPKGEKVAVVQPGSPAKAAGAMINDIIMEVNGESMSGKSHEEVVAALTQPGTQVTISFLQDVTELFPETAGTDAPMDATLAQAADFVAATPKRAELPVKGRKDSNGGASIFGILKKNIGKNLTKISMPVAMNEPLSALQRMCEELENSHLLDQAAACSDPAQRLLYVSAYAVASYAASFYRGGRKPFNPLLGETFEYVCTERKFRYVAEQVSHHPPVCASFASSAQWEVAQQAGVDTKFRPTKLKLVPSGGTRLKLVGHAEVYEWNKVVTCIEDVFNSKRWVDHYGTMNIDVSTGYQAVVKFQEASMFKKSKLRDVTGGIYAPRDDPTSAAKRMPKLTFVGKWNTELVCPELGNRVIFKAPVIAASRIADQFGFSEFCCDLNAEPEEGGGARAALPVSDTRFRPDQRMYELDDENADEKKLELESKQRERRVAHEGAKTCWSPLHFAPKEATPGAPPNAKAAPPQWDYKGTYWARKAAKVFDGVPKLW